MAKYDDRRERRDIQIDPYYRYLDQGRLEDPLPWNGTTTWRSQQKTELRAPRPSWSDRLSYWLDGRLSWLSDFLQAFVEA
jgi:hypothetical protein